MSWTADRTDVTADSTSFTADGWEIVYPLGGLRKVVSPRVTAFAAIDSTTFVTLTWATADALPVSIATITRIPAFVAPVSATGLTYADTDVIHGNTYSYTLFVTDGRTLDSVSAATSIVFH